MAFEPEFGIAPSGTNRFDLAPESLRMVHLAKVHEFVEDDVIDDVWRSLDQPPVEVDDAAGGAGAPAGALIADGNAGDLAVGLGGELADARDEFGDGDGAEVARDMRRAELSDRKFLAAEPDLGWRWFRFFGELALDPRLGALDEVEGFAL